MKICTHCKKKKALDNFYLAKSGVNKEKYSARCKECTKIFRQTYYDKNKDRINKERREARKSNPKLREKIKREKRKYWVTNIERAKWVNAKQRAERKGVEFSIKVTDVVIPQTCPLLEIPLIVGTKDNYENSPSLDRIDPKKGYTKDNVWVISNKANTMKNSATFEELKTFYKNILKYLK